MTSSPPIVIDVEASGFGPGSYPIEVGLAHEDGQPYCRLLRPAPEWTHWDNSAEAVHGVTLDILETHGQDPARVADDLNEMLWGKTVYSDGWSYDVSWIGLLYEATARQQTFRIESIRSLLTETQAGQWSDTRREVIEELGLKRHRASADARILQLTYLRVAASTAAR